MGARDVARSSRSSCASACPPARARRSSPPAARSASAAPRRSCPAWPASRDVEASRATRGRLPARRDSVDRLAVALLFLRDLREIEIHCAWLAVLCRFETRGTSARPRRSPSSTARCSRPRTRDPAMTCPGPKRLHHRARFRPYFFCSTQRCAQRACHRPRIRLRNEKLAQVGDRCLGRLLAEELGLDERAAVPAGTKLQARSISFIRRPPRSSRRQARVVRGERDGEMRLGARRIRLRELADQLVDGLLVPPAARTGG